MLPILTLRKKSLKWASIFFFTFAIGYSISFIKSNYAKESYAGFVIESKSNYFILSSDFEKLYVQYKENTLEVGDYIKVKGEKKELDFYKIESSFDFKKYLNNKGIYHQLEANSIDIKYSSFIKINQIKNNFLSHFDSKTSEFIGELLFNVNSNSNIIDSLKSLHVYKILSLSGFYIYLFYKFFIYIFSFIFNKKWAKCLAIICCFVFLIFNINKFSTIRIIFLLILNFLNEFYFDKKFNRVQILSFSAIIFLLLDYHLAYQDSFIIGYFASFYMILVNKIKNKYSSKFKGRAIAYLLLYLFFIPLEFYYYNEINLLIVIDEFILTILILPFTFLSILCFLKLPLYKSCNQYFKLINRTSDFVGNIKLSLYSGKFNFLILIFYYLFLLLIIYFLFIYFKPMLKICAFTLFSFLTIYVMPIKNLLSVEISFINVGQGDATLIRYKNDAVLIDTGGLSYMDVAKESLIPFFKKKKIYDLDLIITTHNDYDHSGALEGLINNFKVKRYVNTASKFPIKIGNMVFNNLNKWVTEQKDENDRSLIIQFNLMDLNFLIMGDASKQIERKIINDNKKIKIDVLKVGHHGSKTSSSNEFIKFLSPRIAIISCGKNNYYGHPDKDVIAILKRNNVIIRRTDLEGTITFCKYLY